MPKEKTKKPKPAQQMEINNMTVCWRDSAWELQLIHQKMAAAAYVGTTGCLRPWQHLPAEGEQGHVPTSLLGARTIPGDCWPRSSGGHLFLCVKAELEVGALAWPDAQTKPGNPGSIEPGCWEAETCAKDKVNCFGAWSCCVKEQAMSGWWRNTKCRGDTREKCLTESLCLPNLSEVKYCLLFRDKSFLFLFNLYDRRALLILTGAGNPHSTPLAPNFQWLQESPRLKQWE